MKKIIRIFVKSFLNFWETFRNFWENFLKLFETLRFLRFFSSTKLILPLNLILIIFFVVKKKINFSHLSKIHREYRPSILCCHHCSTRTIRVCSQHSILVAWVGNLNLGWYQLILHSIAIWVCSRQGFGRTQRKLRQRIQRGGRRKWRKTIGW